ncbi:MAG: BamA/TamA family outer membrane protein, partial [Bacteroidia bacterium]
QEFRMPVYKRIGVAAFGGVGAVSKKASQLLATNFHASYGLGLRICIDKKENTNLRIDYGFGKDSHGLYIVFAEAF